MRKLFRIFALTKNEQRVVILIVILLVAIAIVKRHYQERESSEVRPVSSPAQASSPERH
jgi:cell division protein FtsL